MDENFKKQLKIFACKARIGAIDGIYCAKAGHPGGLFVDMRSAFIPL
jgi:hypothetical protein